MFVLNRRFSVGLRCLGLALTCAPTLAAQTLAAAGQPAPTVEPAPHVTPNPAPVAAAPGASPNGGLPGSPQRALLAAPEASAPRAPEESDHSARVTDAHSDRVILMPTAETHPEGTVYLSDYDLAVLQIGVAITDDVQLTLTGTPPLGEDAVVPLDLTLKAQVASGLRYRIALLGSATGLVGLDEGAGFLGRVGAVAQLCVDRPCGTSVNLGFNVLLGGPATFALTGLGLSWRLNRLVSVLMEADTLLPLSREVGAYNGIAAGPGVRFSRSRWGVDLSVLALLDAELDGEETLPLLPVVAFTYRFLP